MGVHRRVGRDFGRFRYGAAQRVAASASVAELDQGAINIQREAVFAARGGMDVGRPDVFFVFGFGGCPAGGVSPFVHFGTEEPVPTAARRLIAVVREPRTPPEHLRIVKLGVASPSVLPYARIGEP